MASTYELIVQAVDKTSGPLGKVERSLDKLDRRSQGVSRTLKAAGGALAAFVTGRAVGSIVNTTARFEDLGETLDAVTGSAREGAKAFDFVKKFATQTQFGIEDLTKAYISLKANGVEPTQALLTTFTDTAAVTTDQLGALESMTKLFSRAAAGAGVSLEDLDMLADRGIPVYKILGERIGITRDQLTEFAKEGDNTSLILKELRAGLDDSFGGATKKKADNLSTAMSNFGIEVGLAANKIGSELRPQLTAAINDATKFIQENEKLLQVLGQGLGVAIDSTSKSLKILADNFNIVRDAALAYVGVRLFTNLQKTTAFFNKASGNSKTFGAALNVLGKRMGLVSGAAARAGSRFGGLSTALALVKRAGLGIITLLPRLAAGFAFSNPVTASIVALYTAFQVLKDRMFTIGGVTTNLSEIMRASFFALGNVFKSVAQSIAELWISAMDVVKRAFRGFVDIVSPSINRIMRGFKVMGNSLINTLKAVGAIGIDVWNSLGTNFGLMTSALGASFSRFVSNFQGYTASIRTTWLKLIRLLATKFADFVSQTGSVFNRASELLGFDPVFETMGIQAWATSFDGAIYRSEQRQKELFENGTMYAQQAADTIGQMNFTPNTNLEEIFKSDPLGAFGENVSEKLSAVGESVGGLVTRYRDHNTAIEQANQLRFLQNEAAAHGITVAQAEADAKARQREQQDALAGSIAATTVELQGYDAYLQNLLKTSNRETQETGYAMQAKAALKAELEAGRISLDTYAVAMNTVNQQLGITSQVASDAAAGVNQVTRELSGYEKYLNRITQSANQSANEIGYAMQAKQDLAKQLKDGKISIDAYAQAMVKLNRTTGTVKAITPPAAKTVRTELKKTAEVAKTTGDLIRDGFKSAGDSLKTELATALRTGTGIMDSFKNYFNSALDTILQSIIEKNITGPLTDQLFKLVDQTAPTGDFGGGLIKNMNGSLSKVNSDVSSWGSGLGSLFSSIFSNIGGLFKNFGSGISGFLGNLFGGMGGGGGGGFLGSIVSGIGGLFGGGGGGFFSGLGSLLGFANGGYPPVNRPSIVGERGPELFVPSTTGRVVPNNELGGGGEQTINFNINAVSTRDGIEFLLENKPAIIQMVQQASNKRGRAGILD